MYVNNIQNFQYNKPNVQRRYFQNFCGNLNKTVRSFQLNTKELSGITHISDQFRRLNIIYQTAGSYLTDLLNKGIRFLIPIEATNFILKDTFDSEKVSDVKVEKNYDDKNTDKLITLTIGGKNDLAKFVVSKGGMVDVIADENLAEEDLNKYLTEIDKNHDKLIDSVSEKADLATSFVREVLKDKNFNEIDISSPEQIRDAIKKFIEERKRITILSQMIGRTKFSSKYCSEYNKLTTANKGTLENGNIAFSFEDLGNQYFKGILLAVTNHNAKTKQWFIAMDDGNIYKSPTLELGKSIPRHFLDTDNLTALTPDELKSPELNSMFNYACSHVDSVCRAMIYAFSGRKVIETKTMDQIKEKLNKSPRVITEQPLSEETAKTVKVYDLAPDSIKNMNEIESLMHRITEAYLGCSNKKDRRANMTERSGLIRKKFVNGYIVKDVLLTDKMSLGVSKRSHNGKNDTFFSLGFFDENNNEVAKLKMLKQGKAKLLLKPTATIEFADKMENLINYEFKNDLTEKLLNRLKEACYYHEHYADVNKYIAKSYFNITVLQAVRELMSDKSFYKFDAKKVNEIKVIADDLAKKHRIYPGKAYRVLQAFFPPISHTSNRFLCGKINEYGVSYEAIPLTRSDPSGIRIMTKNSRGKISKCYVIEDDGTTYKLKHLPKNGTRFDMRRSNFIKLDENAMSKEKPLDLIFINLHNTLVVYNDLLEVCLKHGVTLTDDEMMENVQKYKTILNEKNAKTSTIYNSLSELPKYDKDKDFVPLNEELQIRYANMLTEEGKFKSLAEIKIEDVVKQLNRIFEAQVDERSPHLVHELKTNGDIMLNRFSVPAPDDVWITVTKNITNEYPPFMYYSIRIQKNGEVTDIKINPKKYTILRCDKNNAIMENDEGEKLSVIPAKFVSDNPLCVDMPTYFAEIFAEKPNAERRVIKIQTIKKTVNKTLEKEADQAIEKAMTVEVPADVQKEFELENEEEL